MSTSTPPHHLYQLPKRARPVKRAEIVAAFIGGLFLFGAGILVGMQLRFPLFWATALTFLFAAFALTMVIIEQWVAGVTEVLNREKRRVVVRRLSYARDLVRDSLDSNVKTQTFIRSFTFILALAAALFAGIALAGEAADAYYLCYDAHDVALWQLSWSEPTGCPTP